MSDNFFDQFDDPPVQASAAAPQPGENFFDQFDDPVPQAPQPMEPAPSFQAPTGPQFEQPNTVFDQEVSPTPPGVLAWNKPPSPLQGTADFVAPALGVAENVLKPFGFSWENARQAADEMQNLSFEEQNLTPLIGGISGGLDLADSLINAPAGIAQQAMGIAPADRWRADFQNSFQHIPEVAKRIAATPHAFNVAEGVGGIVAPMPGLAPAKYLARIPKLSGWAEKIAAGNIPAAVADIAAGGAIVGGAVGAGEAVKQNRNIGVNDVLLPAASGAVLGGAIGSVPALGQATSKMASQTAGVIKNIFNKSAKAVQQQAVDNSKQMAKGIIGAYNKMQPGERTKMLQGMVEENVQQTKAQQLMDSLGIQDAESRAAVGAMPQGVQPSAALQGLALPQKPEQLVDIAHGARNVMDAATSIEKWAEKVTGEPAAISSPAPEAPFRKTLSPEFYGRKKNQLAAHVSNYADDVKSVVDELATRKAFKDYDEAVFKKALAEAWEKFATDPDAQQIDLAGYVIKRTKVFPKPRIRTQQQLNNAREALTTGVEADPDKKGLAVTLTQKFGDDAHVEYAKIPDDPAEAGKILANLEAAYDGSARAHDMAKVSKINKRLAAVESSLEKKQASKKPNNDLIAELKLEKLQLEGDLEFAKYAEEVLARTEKERGEFHVKTDVPHPAGEKFGTIEAGVEYRHAAQQQILPEGKVAEWQATREEILKADRKRVPLPSFKTSVKTGGVLGALVASLSNQSANAAEVGGRLAASTSPDLLALWNHLPMNEVAIATAIVKMKLPEKAAKALLAHENAYIEIPAAVPLVGGEKVPTMIPLSALWNDTMDNVNYTDRLLNKAGADKAAKEGIEFVEKSLTRDVWDRLGQALRATWGVKMSPEVRETALSALKEGHVTMQEALAGTLDPTFKATPEALEAIAVFEKLTIPQRNAVTMYRIVQKDVMRLVNERHAELSDWIKENPNAANMGAARQARTSLEFMMRSLGKRSESANDFDSFISKLVSNWMDFNFFWNLDHHATNLTDMFIAGSGRVGLRNIWRANKLLLGNAELKRAFQNSNLTGGYRADQAEITQVAGKKKRFWSEHDLESDLVNADRVFLGHALQYFQKFEDDIRATGFKGNDEDFAAAVVKDDGRLEPEIVMDVWSKSAETLSRTLGVDIYRVNTNILGMAPVARSLGIFVRQPARLSRLAMNYMAEGNFKALYTTLGVTMALGGAAAIPGDLKLLGEFTSPDSYFKMAALADELDLFYKATGEKLTPKITWSILWLTLAAGNPASDAMNGPMKILEGTVGGDWEKIFKGLERTVPYVAPRIAGVPTGVAVRGVDAAKRGFFDKQEKAYVERFGQLQFKETGNRSLDSFPDQLREALGPFFPGKSAWAENYKQSRDEKFGATNNVFQGGLKLVGLGGIAPKPREQDDQFYRQTAHPLDPTNQGYDDRYNLPDILTSPFRPKP